MAPSRKRPKLTVKEMRFRNDPMVRLYESLQNWLQERGRPLVIALCIMTGALVLYIAGYYLLEYRSSSAAAAFAQAYEKFNAPVVEGTSTSTPLTGRYYTDERLKWQETAEAFERLSSEYPSYYGAIGSYYAGASYLNFDPEKGLQFLQRTVDMDEQPASDLARMAMAEHYFANGDLQKSTTLYEALLNSQALPKQAVHLGLGRVYEAAGDTQKAVEAYFEAARIDRMISAGSEAERRLQALAPDRVRDLPMPATAAN